MCSFLFARTRRFLEPELLNKSNYYAQKRGPDYTGISRLIDQVGFNIVGLHNLLDISGTGSKQPTSIADNGQVKMLLFNGEIYNFDKYRYASDTDALKNLLESTNYLDLIAALDGDFVILVYDESQSAISVVTDSFLTKPVFFGLSSTNQDFAIASYASTLDTIGVDKIEMAKPNCVVKIIFSSTGYTMALSQESNRFDLRQQKNNYHGWVDAFIAGVEKRATHGSHKPFVCLSSGYDSGAICLALNLLNIDYETFSIGAGEETKVLQQRIELNQAASCTRAHVWNGLSRWEAWRMARDIASTVEFFSYVHEDAPGFRKNIRTDEAAMGLNFIAMQAASAGLKVCLSGAGADEIHSDYGILGRKIYHHSEFGGLFPEDLSSIFPWRKFYGDTQRSYLMKEEMVLGRHGIEGRYPFLDRAVVQEFLSLDVGLKNSEYKAPMAHFLRKHGYPFEAGTKRGFASKSDPGTGKYGRRHVRA